MLLKKLTSKKGQVSMEIGILVAAAVAVASIAAFFYVKSVRSSADNVRQASTDTINAMGTAATGYADSLQNI